MSFLDLVKPRQLSNWADESEAHDEIAVLFAQPSLTMEEFAKCVYELVQRCHLDLAEDKTAFYYKVNDTYIDMMVRNHIIISITSDKGVIEPLVVNETAETETGVQPSETEETPADDDEKKEDNPGADSTATGVADPEEEQEGGGWTTVTKKSRGGKASAVSPIYFFRDAANSAMMDFVCMVDGTEELVEKAKEHPWAHGFSAETNLVYDFYNCHRRGRYRIFHPNHVYTSKFAAWMKNQRVPDQSRFAIFVEVEGRKKVLVDFRFGLANVRQFVKRYCLPRFEWAHCYCQDHDFIYDFHIENGSFVQGTRRLNPKITEDFKLKGPLTSDHIELHLHQETGSDSDSD